MKLPTDDSEFAALLQQHWPTSDNPGEVLDEEILAAYVEGRLTPEQQDKCDQVLAQGGHAYEEYLIITEALVSADVGRPKTVTTTTRSSSGVNSNKEPDQLRRRLRITAGIAASIVVLCSVSLVNLIKQRSDLATEVAMLESSGLEQQFALADFAADRVMESSGSTFWVGTPAAFALKPPGPGQRGLSPSPEAQSKVGEFLKPLESMSGISSKQRLRLAEIEIRAGNLKQARRNLEIASDLQDTSEHQNALACLLLAEAKQLPQNDDSVQQLRAEARTILEALVAERPGLPSGLFNLASLYLSEGQRQLAEEEFEQAHSLFKSSVATWERFLATDISEAYRSIGENRRQLAIAMHESI